MSKRPPGETYWAKYNDPVTTALLSLPFVDHDRRVALARAWDSNKPAEYVYRVLEWYTRHDESLLLFSRLVVVVTPVLLISQGVGVEWIIPSVVGLMFVIEKLERVRIEKERAQAVEESKREYWRAVERPREKARMRELRRELREQEDWDEPVEESEEA